MDIYVGNLAYATTDDELRQVFERHGAVESDGRVIGVCAGKLLRGQAFDRLVRMQRTVLILGYCGRSSATVGGKRCRRGLAGAPLHGKCAGN